MIIIVSSSLFILLNYFLSSPGTRQKGAASCDLLPESWLHRELRQWQCEAEVTSISMRANYAHGQTHAGPGLS